MAMEWEREETLIAERFQKDEIPGFLTKEFKAKENEYVVVERKREIYREMGPGEFSISSFIGDLTCILLLDKSEKKMEREIKNVLLGEGEKIDMKFKIAFRIFHSDHFSRKLMGDRRRFTLQDIWNELLSDVLYRKNLPELKKIPAQNLLKEDFREKVKADIKSEMLKKFKEWGLILTAISIDFVLPEKIGEHRPEKTEAEEERPVKEKEAVVEKPEEKANGDIKKYETDLENKDESPEKREEVEFE